MSEDLPWFRKFVIYHIAANPHQGFPRLVKGGDNADFIAYFGTWKRAFLDRKVTEAEANAASAAMATRGSTFPDEHLAALLRHVEDGRRRASIAANAEIRRARARRHLLDLEDRERCRDVYARLPFEQQKAIRDEVLADYASPPPEKYVMMLCIERLREMRSEGHGR